MTVNHGHSSNFSLIGRTVSEKKIPKVSVSACGVGNPHSHDFFFSPYTENVYMFGIVMEVASYDLFEVRERVLRLYLLPFSRYSRKTIFATAVCVSVQTLVLGRGGRQRGAIRVVVIAWALNIGFYYYIFVLKGVRTVVPRT